MHQQRDFRRQPPILSYPCGNLETNAEEIGIDIFSFLNPMSEFLGGSIFLKSHLIAAAIHFHASGKYNFNLQGLKFSKLRPISD